jgi:hypothetical protein
VLRGAPDGVPGVSTYTIWCVPHDAGFTWSTDGSWCDTGTAIRKRKTGMAIHTDPDATANRLDRSSVHPGRTAGVGWSVQASSITADDRGPYARPGSRATGSATVRLPAGSSG